MQRYSLRFSSWMSLLTTSSFTHRISWYKNVAEQKMCFYSCSEFQNLVARNKNICFRFVYHQYSDRRHMVQFKFWWLSVAILGVIYLQTFWNVLVCTSQSRGFKPMYQLLNKGVLFLFLIRTRLFWDWCIFNFRILVTHTKALWKNSCVVAVFWNELARFLLLIANLCTGIKNWSVIRIPVGLLWKLACFYESFLKD